jgi:hypothetical protein
MLTKEQIVQLLKDDDRAIARALVVLTARQTADEQATEQTRHLNGRGYRPCHARMGVSMSKFFERNGYLSSKQIAYWRIVDKTGSMRIGIYAGQLLEEAHRKAAQRAASVEQSDREYIAQRQARERAAATPLPGLTGSAFGLPPAADVPSDAPNEADRDYCIRGYRDYGNDMEHRMILAEQLGEVLDSDDPSIIDPIANEISEIDTFWARIRQK